MIQHLTIPPPATPSQSDERCAKNSDRVSSDRIERRSAEDAAIDAAIKRSIDEFGA